MPERPVLRSSHGPSASQTGNRGATVARGQRPGLPSLASSTSLSWALRPLCSPFFPTSHSLCARSFTLPLCKQSFFSFTFVEPLCGRHAPLDSRPTAPLPCAAPLSPRSAARAPQPLPHRESLSCCTRLASNRSADAGVFRGTRSASSPAVNQEPRRNEPSPLQNRPLPELDESYVSPCNCTVLENC